MSSELIKSGSFHLYVMVSANGVVWSGRLSRSRLGKWRNTILQCNVLPSSLDELSCHWY